MPYIKNIEHEKVVDLAGEVQYMPGQVVSKTLAQNEAVSVTLFAFEKGEEIGTHDYLIFAVKSNLILFPFSTL